MEQENNRGRKSSVTLMIGFNDFKIKLKENKILDCFTSSVKPFNSGAYIPISQKYRNKRVMIIVLED